jgi:WD40 repeat protein
MSLAAAAQVPLLPPIMLMLLIFVLQTMDGHSNAIICMVVASRLMYTGSADCTAKCWVTEYGDCTKQFRGHKHSVVCIKLYKGIRE